MNQVDASSRLCNYDPRNGISAMLQDPDEPTPVAGPDCMCDNCFYGRTPMAEALLRLAAAVDDIIGPPETSDRFGYVAARNIMDDELRARLLDARLAVKS